MMPFPKADVRSGHGASPLAPQRIAAGQSCSACPATLMRSVLRVGLAADRNALGLLLGLGRLWQPDSEHAVLERRVSLLLVDLERQRDAALETTVVALAEAAVLVVRLRRRGVRPTSGPVTCNGRCLPRV